MCFPLDMKPLKNGTPTGTQPVLKQGFTLGWWFIAIVYSVRLILDLYDYRLFFGCIVDNDTHDM